MGSIKKMLHKSQLQEREVHHSRLFVDLAENIHIHHREFRTVFSLDEYFEYADIITNSTKDVRNFLSQNPEYKEGEYPTTIMIAGGKDRQLKFLSNSPKPNKTKYFSDNFAIELQDEFVTDEIHIHYRDFRIALNRKHFKEMATGFELALKKLNEFEEKNEYEREMHNDRLIKSFNNSSDIPIDTKLMGTRNIPLCEIKSNWHQDISSWSPDQQAVKLLEEEYRQNGRLFPIVLSKIKNGKYTIIDGHHRFFVARKLELEAMDCVVTDLDFKSTERIRKAERLLKEFDSDTNYRYSISPYFKEYTAYKLNRHYFNSFSRLMRHQKLWYRIARKIKRFIFGKKNIFKTFNESHNR